MRAMMHLFLPVKHRAVGAKRTPLYISESGAFLLARDDAPWDGYLCFGVNQPMNEKCQDDSQTPDCKSTCYMLPCQQDSVA